MANVYTCRKCGASVTIDGRPDMYGCHLTPGTASTAHDWNKVGELKPTENPSSTRENTGTTASNEFLETLLRMMFEGMANTNLPVATRILIASPLIALIGFGLYMLVIASSGTENASAEPETYSSYEPNVSEVRSPPMSAPAPAEVLPASATPASPGGPIGQILESRTGRLGTVSVRYDVKTVQGYLYVNDIPLPKDLLAVAPSISQEWDLGAHEVYLLSDDTGGAGCPATYFLLNVQKEVASVSENFGNCSDVPEMTAKDGEIVIHFGTFGTAPESTIRFADGKVFSSEDSKAETPISMTQVKI